MPTVCVDTNVWVYALSKPRSGDTGKHQAAQAAIASTGRVTLTPQIINELGFVLRRKQGWTDQELQPLIEQLFQDCELYIPSANWPLSVP
jgi:predicted nucleic acid-binding protein